MKIAIFSDTFLPQTNGVANVAYQSAKNLAELGHKVIIFTVTKKSNYSNNLNLENLKIVRLPSLPALAYPGERLTIPLGISFPYLKKFKPDVIHVHTPFSVGLEGALAAKLFKIPLVGTHHTFYDHYLKHIKLDYDWMKKFSWKCCVGFYNFCDLVINPSQSLTDALKEKGLKVPTEIIRNSIDTDLFQPVSNAKEKNLIKKSFGVEDKSIVYMGRLSYEKSIDKVIKAFALMLEKSPDLKLMLVGDGPEKKKLEDLAKELKIENKIIFTGFLYKNGLIKALQANDVFLSACKNENMPLSVAQAMATGLPLVVVKENGLAELVKENINGFFCKTDNPEDMAEKTLKLLSNTGLLKKFGAGSRKMAMEYSNGKITNLLIESYKKIISK
ncbi:MAG: glycosyltransferase [Spirochaetota bacterium]